MKIITDFIKKCKDNPGNIIGFTGVIGLILIQFGFKVDMEWLKATTVLVCTLLGILGICNNPNTPGLDIPFTQLKLFAPKDVKEEE